MNNLQAEWAFLLMDSLAEAGITEVVVSPGSRSTPFVIAASQNPRLRCYNIIDERAAGFFALGQARMTGKPSLLICTSGSAAAHYLPAITEAASAYVPILILTADRPFSLQDCGANQTMDQGKLFGQYVRKFIELGLPQGPSRGGLLALRRMMAQAVFTSSHPLPGPVHINARATKPLEPPSSLTEEEKAFSQQVKEIARGKMTKASASVLSPSEETIKGLKEAICKSQRGLVVCGPGPIGQADIRSWLKEFLTLTGFPLFAEPASQFRLTQEIAKEAYKDSDIELCIDTLDTLLGIPAFLEKFQPDLIIQLGSSLTSGGFEHFLDQKIGEDGTKDPRFGCQRFVIAPYGWNDPHSTADELILSDVKITLERLCHALSHNGNVGRTKALEQTFFRQSLSEAHATAVRAIEEVLHADAEILGESALTEPQAVYETMAHLPKDSVIMLGNSLPIREVNTYARTGLAEALVLSQRGLSGIDGLLSGTAGSASMTHRPVTLLLGDVSFLHDLSGMALFSSVTQPVVIVVIQNQGGRIFDQLPVSKLFPGNEQLATHFLTPQAVSLQDAVRAYGHKYLCASSREGLASALQTSYLKPGCTVIEVEVLPQSAADSSRQLKQKLESALPGLFSRQRNAEIDDPRVIAAKEENPIFLAGPSFKEAFVLLHGFTQDPSMWDPFTKILDTKIPVLAPALLGHAASQTLVEGTGFFGEVDRMAKLIQSWTEQQDVGKVHLVGYSLGGRIALGLLLRYPQLFAEGTLLSTQPGLQEGSSRMARAALEKKWIDVLLSKGTEEFVKQWEKNELFESQENLPKERLAAQRKMRLAHRPEALALSIKELGLSQMPSYWDWLPWIRIPIHLITGERDTKFTMLAKQMKELLPVSKLSVLPNCGHHPLLEQPETCIRGILGENSDR